MNVCEAHSWCCCCGEIWSKRKRVFEDDVFIENTRLVSGSKTQDLNLRANLVLNMSRGPPGQWFPEIEHWASAIFVGTSGIPPKIIYRSVKSYNPYKVLPIKERVNLCGTAIKRSSAFPKATALPESSILRASNAFTAFVDQFLSLPSMCIQSTL